MPSSRAQVGNTLQRVSTFGGRNGSSTVRRRFSFLLQQAPSTHTLHHLCIQGWALASTRQLHSQGPVSVHAHRTEGVPGSEGGEGADGVVGCIGVGGGHGDGNGVGRGKGDVNGDGDGDRVRVGMKTETGVEANGGAQDGNIISADRRSRLRPPNSFVHQAGCLYMPIAKRG